MKGHRFLLATSAIMASLAGPAAAQSIVSEPLGFNTIPCPVSSDTIAGVPFRRNGSQQGALAALPDTTTIPGSAILSIAGNPGFGTFTNHYAKFTSGAMNGRNYPITANTASTVTVALNGDVLTGVAVNDGILVAEYWTLDGLFPPANATTDPATTGHAIVASTSRFASGRKTEVLLPDQQSPGSNLAPNRTFYIYNGGWRQQGVDVAQDLGGTVLYPDTYFIVRHTSNVPTGTSYKCSGEVELGVLAIPLSTQSTTGLNIYQDNFVAIPRAIDVTLNDLALAPGAFVPSTSRFTSGRKDELLVFNNVLQAFNKAASVTYYYYNGAWRKQGADYTVDFGTDVIPAGAGFMVRKAPTSDGSTAFWNNPASYTNNP